MIKYSIDRMLGCLKFYIQKNVNSHKILEKSMKYALMFVFNMVECV